MARKGTKAYRNETVEVFWGINRKRGRIESVYLTRGGVLSMMGEDAVTVTHPIMPGRDAKHEIVVVFGLTDVFSAPAGMTDTAWVKLRRAELQEKIDREKAANLTEE